MHDPYGLRDGANDNYTYVNPGWGDESSRADRYSWGVLNKVLFDAPDQDGWARIVSK